MEDPLSCTFQRNSECVDNWGRGQKDRDSIRFYSRGQNVLMWIGFTTAWVCGPKLQRLSCAFEQNSECVDNWGGTKQNCGLLENLHHQNNLYCKTWFPGHRGFQLIHLLRGSVVFELPLFIKNHGERNLQANSLENSFLFLNEFFFRHEYSTNLLFRVSVILPFLPWGLNFQFHNQTLHFVHSCFCWKTT